MERERDAVFRLEPIENEVEASQRLSRRTRRYYRGARRGFGLPEAQPAAGPPAAELGPNGVRRKSNDEWSQRARIAELGGATEELFKNELRELADVVFRTECALEKAVHQRRKAQPTGPHAALMTLDEHAQK